ncbi:hypothetical protein NEMIN01_1177 [Nematocida minor]|uniref:uncharacterized protein n=1 Tax=Nematocida minor TaxID=1912983 RepID=UPI00221F334A|nr:uncharacterized protein NEMIN01_1177 [Nematocida minor]KAI5190712.1 hypothetical protein NEMIN01_1177 [Nematocida minor]
MKAPFPVLFRCLGYGLNRTLEVEGDALMGIKFTKNALPLLNNNTSIIATDRPISIQYRLKIRNIHPLTIESGVHVADIGILRNNKYESVSVYNRPIVPDFTTPYLVFGICGGVIVCIMSAFSKVLLRLI